MHTIQIRNVHQALPAGLQELRSYGIRRDSRNGPVTVFDAPVTTVYMNPNERVLFWPERDANPFFHLFESLWMLGGRNDVHWVAQFVKRMRSFSDDGKTLHGAYGHRWRNAFGVDQLQLIIKRLAADPDDRRCVLQMWDTQLDLDRAGKDVPCNTTAFFSINHLNELDMTVCNRSNDIVWGAYGANAVHFSVLQEYMAYGIQAESGREVGVGRYYQMSNNLHAYLDTLGAVASLPDTWLDPHRGSEGIAPYGSGIVEPFPLVNGSFDTWKQDLEIFLHEGPIVGLRDRFFRRVITPMWKAHEAYKTLEGEDRYTHALEILDSCAATDWRLACQQWIRRRWDKALRAADDGVSYE